MIPSPRSAKFRPFKGQTASKFSVSGTPKLDSHEDYFTSGGPDDLPICLPNTKFNSCPASPLTKPKSSLNNTSSAISLISDFYNKDQVGRAIDLVNSLHNRVQVVDHILKRRDEIKEIENQMKLAKAGPIIKGLVSDFRKRMFKKGDTKSQGQFRKSVMTLFAQEAQTERANDKNSDDPFATGAYFTNFKNKKSPFVSHQPTDETVSSMDQTAKPEPADDKTPTNMSNTMQEEVKVPKQKPTILSVSQYLGIDNPTLSTNRNSETPNPPKNEPIFNLNKTPVPSSHREPTDVELILKQSLSLKKVKSNEDSKGQNSYRKKKKISADCYELGKEAFKKELCKYLLKNESQMEYQDVISNLGKAKQTKIKNIELDVKAKLEAIQNHKRSHSYQIPSTRLQRGYTSEPVNSNGNSPQEYKTFFNNTKSKKSGDQGYSKFRKDADLPLKVDDESFVSFTETQLDHLYRQTHKIKGNLKVLDDKLGSTVPLKHWKNIEKTKMHKLHDLHHNSGEILKLTHKKLTM